MLRLLVEARHSAELSQRDLAEILGEHHSWVAKVELGERRVDVIEFARIARALGADPVDLFSQVAATVRS